jgi:hypothetical protein
VETAAIWTIDDVGSAIPVEKQLADFFARPRREQRIEILADGIPWNTDRNVSELEIEPTDGHDDGEHRIDLVDVAPARGPPSATESRRISAGLIPTIEKMAGAAPALSLEQAQIIASISGGEGR